MSLIRQQFLLRSATRSFGTSAAALTQVYVSNLPWKASEQDLIDVFQGYEVTHFKLIREQETGRSKGFGFANFSTDEAAEAFVTGNPQLTLHGRTLRIARAINRRPVDAPVSQEQQKQEQQN